MDSFSVPQWEATTEVDKTCKKMFGNKNVSKTVKPVIKKRQKAKRNKSESEGTQLHQVEDFATIKRKIDKQLDKIDVKKIPVKAVRKIPKAEGIKEPSKPKNKLSRLDFFGVKQKRKQSKPNTKSQQFQEPTDPKRTKKSKPVLTLREKMLARLRAARFRYLNQQMYTSTGIDAKKYFEENSADFKAYHEGYRLQVDKWPINPLDIIIRNVKKMPENYVIADLGCGEAKLQNSVKQKVHSFDLVSLNENVIACNMNHVPLEDNSVNVAVFCLSLMGTSLRDYVLEANRILKIGGILKIAEVESRFEDVEDFVKILKAYGFKLSRKDFSHSLFYFLDFTKHGGAGTDRKLPQIELSPCLYKRR